MAIIICQEVFGFFKLIMGRTKFYLTPIYTRVYTYYN